MDHKSGSKSKKSIEGQSPRKKDGQQKKIDLLKFSEPGGVYYGEQKPNINELMDMDTFDWTDDYRGYMLVRAIRHGIPYTNFEKLSASMPFKQDEWATILHTTTRTLDRYKEKNSSFKSQQSERILEIKQLYGKGLEVFGDRVGFDQWLILENLPLGRIRPIDLLDTAVGIQMVMDELVRIEHGILA